MGEEGGWRVDALHRGSAVAELERLEQRRQLGACAESSSAVADDSPSWRRFAA